jgi:uncharacterized protein (TIGR03067 family)
MAALSPASGPTAVRSPTDLDALQGAWVSVAGRREVRLLVAGSRYTFEFVRSGVVYMGTLYLDPHDDPKRMDMRIEEGPAEHRGLTTYCIYKLDGEELCWCPSRPGSAERLFRFPAVDDDRYLSLVFHPIRPGRG